MHTQRYRPGTKEGRLWKDWALLFLVAHMKLLSLVLVRAWCWSCQNGQDTKAQPEWKAFCMQLMQGVWDSENGFVGICNFFFVVPYWHSKHTQRSHSDDGTTRDFLCLLFVTILLFFFLRLPQLLASLECTVSMYIINDLWTNSDALHPPPPLSTPPTSRNPTSWPSSSVSCRPW